MNEEIQNTVESLFGKDVKIIDCETSSSMQQDEMLLINGIPVNLDGIPSGDAQAIKSALLNGQVPAVEHLNQLLFRAGLAQQPIEVETILTVKSSLTTTEEVTVSRNGRFLDEQTIETKEYFNHQSQQKEIWQPSNEHNSMNKLCKKVKGTQLADNSSNSTNSSINDSETNQDGNRTCWSNAINTKTASTSFSAISSSSVITDSNQIARSGSIESSSTAIGDCSIRSSNLSSCDSGHDDKFYRNSIPTLSTQNQNQQTQNDSLYCSDLATSNSKSEMDPVLTKLSYPSGTLDLLIDILLPMQLQKKSEAVPMQFVFLLCSRLFLQPHELLAKIAEKFYCKLSPTVAEKIIHLFEFWLQICPNDFRNNSFMQEVSSVLQNCQKTEKKFNFEVTKILQDISHNLAQLDLQCKEWNQFIIDAKTTFLKLLSEANSIKSSKLLPSIICKSENVSSMCFADVKELSHQLTIIEHYYLALIHPDEILEILCSEQFQCKLWDSSTNQKKPKFSYNQSKSSIEAYMQWFDRLSYISGSEIVKFSKKSSLRVQLIDFWIETALECFNIGNFNSLMAILTGLNLPAVSRLKKTWSKVQRIKLEGLKHQMDPSLNFSTYRSTMKAAVWRSERESAREQERAIIPFFSLFLKDFVDINESTAIKLSNEQINFEKCRQLGDQLRSFSEWKHAKCPYEKNDKMITYLLSVEICNEAEMLRASYVCESPYDSKEKDHYKSLKSETNSCQSSN